MDVIIDNYLFPVVIEFSRKKNSSATIRKGKIYLRISSRLSLIDRGKHINELKDWAVKRIEKEPEKYIPKDTSLQHGQEFSFFGDPYRIWISETMNKRASAVMKNKIILCRIPRDYDKEMKDKAVRTLVRKILVKHNEHNVGSFVRLLNEKYFNNQINDVRIKNFKARWGCCSLKNDVELSFSLLRAPLPVIEYVVVHELAHTVYRNHSKSFWRRVEKALPDFRERKKWLNRNGDSLIF